MKAEKDENKVTSAISANCKYELGVLASLMQLNLQKTVQFVLEKYVPVLLNKELNKKLKGVVINTEE